MCRVVVCRGQKIGEGAVITRNRDHADDSDGVNNGVWRTNPPTNWYRLETNYDHWLPVPSNDDRRDPANKMMTAIGPDAVGPETLFTMLSTAPVLNDNTVYTAIMCPSLHTYHTTVRTTYV